MQKLTNFALYELVSKPVWDLLGGQAIKLFNQGFISDVDQFITDLKADTTCTAVYVNDWYWGGAFTDSGYRDRSSTVGSSGSQHRKGCALDLKFVGISLDSAYEYLLANQRKYPHIKRVESLEHTRRNNRFGGWLHVDGLVVHKGRLYVFNP